MAENLGVIFRKKGYKMSSKKKKEIIERKLILHFLHFFDLN